MLQSNILSNGSYLKTQGAALLTGAVIALSSIQPAFAGRINASPDEVAGGAGETIYIDVLANDSGLGRKSVSVSVVTPPANGTAWVNSTNKVVYQSDSEYSGTDTLVYSVRRKWRSDTAGVTIQVIGVTDPAPDPLPENSVPVAMADSATLDAGTALTIDVLANDDGLLDGPLTVDLVSIPANGQVQVNADNTVTFTAFSDYEGSDDFTYRVTDADGETASALVSLNVQCPQCVTDPVPENSVPVAISDSATVDAGAAQTINILANDDGLLDGPINIDLPTLPANGQATVNADNTVTYTAFPDYEGSDDFTYRITDADGETATAMVSLNVQCPLCVKDTNVTLSWDPNPENVSGYWVVYGDTPESATTYLSDLVTESGDFNPSAPAVIYSAAADLGANTGDQVCFRVGARLDLLESSLSEAVCGIL
ncbi:MAG: Ig-like domain-containing protein [Pseudomonadota bacterium]|nr:Ig-like domain-containing protein [Pseudomonadota bacterium]